MKVFKFGGASVKDTGAVKNITSILEKYRNEKLVVVISAMGKITNALEQVINSAFKNDGQLHLHLEKVKKFHYDILGELIPDHDHKIYDLVNNIFLEIDWVLEEPVHKGYDYAYDQVVSAGELLSTRIIASFLELNGIPCQWIDARDIVQTDNSYREGIVNWNATALRCKSKISNLLESGTNIIITQGFIGGTSENYTTTLGREGSDYTAAILAHCMNADAVYIWKDVPGVLNADPKFYPDAQKLDMMSYHDAIELAYFGASVIHPKTIKPLENKNIPLHVRSFMSPSQPGTIIGKDLQTKPLIPSFIFKMNQILVSISAKDFSFIAEKNLSGIFGLFAAAGIKINLMQNSAISFSVCMDNDPDKINTLLDQLKLEYKVLYNDKLQLYTVRHYYQSTIDRLIEGREVLLEQRSRHTAQFVVREK